MRQEREKTSWTPKTEIGKKVVAGEITTIDQIWDSGKKILEPEIIDYLLPDLKDEVLEVSSTQRMTSCGRKQQMRAVVLLGNGAGYVAVGVGKAVETRDAIAEAIQDAKKHLVKIELGCGSWECGCGTPHSMTRRVKGQNGSTEITLKPAPRGVGLVAGEVSKKVLAFAGVKDSWSFAKGRTRNVLNMVLATLNALESLNHLKKGHAA